MNEYGILARIDVLQHVQRKLRSADVAVQSVQFQPFSNNSKFRIFTLKFLSIATPNIINFPFVSNAKLMVLGVPIVRHTLSKFWDT